MAKIQSLIDDLYKEIENNYNDVVVWRRHLHKHPELSFEEVKTAKYIKEKLLEFGLDVRTDIGGNGLIGILRGAHEGKTVALRADFDALPIQDDKDVPYKSTVDGVMHACGHDGHTAALLGTAKTLSAFKEQLNGNVIFIFQHAEEKPPGGAVSMVKELDMDEVDYVFGAHLASDLPVGKIGFGAGDRMAAVDKFTITITGKGGHGASPHEANDPIVIGSDVVNALQKIVSRRTNPLESAVVTIGVFRSGNAFNVIPNEALLEGTVRTFNETIRYEVKQHIYDLVEGIVQGYRADVDIDYVHGYPALINPEEEVNVLKAIIDKEKIVDMGVSMGAEDFSYFLLEKPGSYFRVGSRNDDEATHYPHHHPRFDIDERALIETQKVFVKIVSHYLCSNK